jgi:hypothetical protein
MLLSEEVEETGSAALAAVQTLVDMGASATRRRTSVPLRSRFSLFKKVQRREAKCAVAQLQALCGVSNVGGDPDVLVSQKNDALAERGQADGESEKADSPVCAALHQDDGAGSGYKIGKYGAKHNYRHW